LSVPTLSSRQLGGTREPRRSSTRMTPLALESSDATSCVRRSHGRWSPRRPVYEMTPIVSPDKFRPDKFHGVRAHRGRQPDSRLGGARALGADDYDEMWRRLEDFLRHNPGARQRRRLVLRALRKYAPGATEILDVGCGLGEMVSFLGNAIPNVQFTGVDFSSGAVDSCRRRLPSHVWVVADVVADELRGQYDAVICSELLEHLDEPAKAMTRIGSLLTPGGTIVVTVPNGKVFATERAVGHVRHPTLAMLQQWLEAADIDVLEAQRWGWPGYLSLKYAANLDPNRALAAFGSGEYSWTKRRANDLAYAMVRAGSLPDHVHGPQTVVVGRRRHWGETVQ
jgi:SAM-dependent methyltransferase